MRYRTFATPGEYYFCTDTIVSWQYVFTSVPYFNIIIDSLKYCQLEKGLRVHGYVIMPNHTHAILSARNNDLADVVRDYKRFTARKLLENLEQENRYQILDRFSQTAKNAGKGNDHKVWLAGSYPFPITSRSVFYQKLNYIHYNPVKKGFVDKPEYWLYSSARNYRFGDHSIMNVELVHWTVKGYKAES